MKLSNFVLWLWNKKFSILFSMIFVVMIIFGILIISQNSKPKISMTLRLNWILYAEHTPFYVALDKGYYLKEGIDLEILPGAGSNLTTALVEKNEYEIGYSSAPSIINAVDKGAQIKAIAGICQHDTSSFIFRKDANIKTVQDLVGKRIALSIGDAQTSFLYNVLPKMGLSRDSLKVVEFPNAITKENAIFTKDADVLSGYYLDQVARLKNRYKIELDFIKFTDYGIDNLSSALVTSTYFINQHPDLVRGFLKATQKGIAFMIEHPEQSADIFYKYVKTASREDVEKTIKLFIPLLHTPNSEGRRLGWTSPKDWIETREKTVGKKLDDDLDESWVNIYFTNEFLSDIY